MSNNNLLMCDIETGKRDDAFEKNKYGEMGEYGSRR